jgi:hypothetical protein
LDWVCDRVLTEPVAVAPTGVRGLGAGWFVSVIVGVGVRADWSLAEARVIGAAAAEVGLVFFSFEVVVVVEVEVGVGDDVEDVESAAGGPEGVPAAFVIVGAEVGVVTDGSVGG